MKMVAVVSWIPGLLVIGAGYLGYQAGSLASLTGSIVWAVALVIAGWFSWKNNPTAGYASGVLTFLLAIYFAYRFIASESFIPAGVLLIITFIGLFLVLLGVFIGPAGERKPWLRQS